ncbi:hypothetical protein [Nocardia sp. NPDC059239]|uniref:hypothetical protein n=1 Tax=Nocardia sp. NPDC059239 TaxID=3346785 RepID=UPI0036B0F318
MTTPSKETNNPMPPITSLASRKPFALPMPRARGHIWPTHRRKAKLKRAAEHQRRRQARQARLQDPTP